MVSGRVFSPSFLYSASAGEVFASCFLADIIVEEIATTNATVTSSAERECDLYDIDFEDSESVNESQNLLISNLINHL